MRPVFLLAALAFGLLSCSGWCAGCTDTGGTTTFIDGGACFQSSARCGFPALPHPPAITVTEINCDGG